MQIDLFHFFFFFVYMSSSYWIAVVYLPGAPFTNMDQLQSQHE